MTAAHVLPCTALDLLTDALGGLVLEDGELAVEDLREAAETLLPALYDALREAGFGGSCPESPILRPNRQTLVRP